MTDTLRRYWVRRTGLSEKSIDGNLNREVQVVLAADVERVVGIIEARCAGGPSLSPEEKLSQALDCRDAWANKLIENAKQLAAKEAELARVRGVLSKWQQWAKAHPNKATLVRSVLDETDSLLAQRSQVDTKA